MLETLTMNENEGHKIKLLRAKIIVKIEYGRE